MCQQTGGLVAREIEAWGVPTITIGNFPARMERLRPPRGIHVRFPRGAMFGEPGNPSKQRGVLEGALAAAASITRAGGTVELPYRWEVPPVAWRGRQITEGP
ncbi:MAG: hypothetical protein ACREMB_08520 [Candidatus Rokuibacteriota bacterium]